MRSKGIHLSLALIASIGVISLSGCGGGSGDGDSARLAQTIDATRNTVTSVELVKNDGVVHAKGFYQFELIGVTTDKQKINLTNKASWNISDAQLGKIDKGYFSGSGIGGSFTLTAEYAGLPAATQTVDVSAESLSKIEISHATGSVDECRDTTLTAKAYFGDRVLPYAVNWKVVEGTNLAAFADKTKATLSTKNEGTVKIVAIGEDNNKKEIESNQLTLTVDNGLTKIKVTTDKPTEMKDGETATVKVEGIYGDESNPIDITGNATISASVSSLLTIDGKKITAKNGSTNGSPVTLKGACGGAEGTQELIIKERQLKSIEIKSASGNLTSNLTLTEGNELSMQVTATYIDDTTKEEYTSSSLYWEVEDTDNVIPDDRMSKITIPSPGKLSVANDLDLSTNATIYMVAEIRDAQGNVIKNPSGAELKDTINVTIVRN